MSILRRRLMMADHYVGGGLLLHLDGINNTGHGHDPNPAVWADLSGNGHDATLTRIVDGDLFGDRYMDGDFCWGNSDLIQRPSVMTVEVVADINTYPYPATLPEGWAVNNSIYVKTTYSVSCWGPGGAWVVYGDIQPLSLDGRYTGGLYYKACSGEGNPIYLNGVQNAELKNAGGGSRYIQLAHKNDQPTVVIRARVYAVRVYDRVLSADEVAHNFAIDQRRFGV